MSLNALFVASEAVPLAGTGGPGDMIGVCASTLQCVGMGTTVMPPDYPDTITQLQHTRTVCEWTDLPGGPARLLSGCMGVQGIPILPLGAPALFARPGNPHLGAHGKPYENSVLRFAAFSQTTARVVAGMPGVHHADITQTHDWHTGLVSLSIKRAQMPVKTAFAVHNLTSQGNFPVHVVRNIDVSPDTTYEAEFWG